VLERAGPERVRQIMDMLAATARTPTIGWQPPTGTAYVNTIAVEQQAAFPGDLAIEERLASLMRWNALAMVVRANQAYGELGGHIASYASAADLFEVGFNHFFKGGAEGDLVFFQPHSAPGVYARAFLEGRLSEADLANYRQEISATGSGARGLSSYPHPWLMPDFWQFPTGSMGLGPISSIYQARFMRYLEHRGLQKTQHKRVWGVFGDGEMDEPESMSALTLAAREKLDNLTWVVNCNLQRLDGPVRGNGRIIDELESLFAGAGWRVIKLVWGSDWDGLFARDTEGALTRTFARTVDGQFQTFAAKDGRYNREHFFGQDPALAALAQGLTDEQIDRLKRGGHDLVKIHAAYHAATHTQGQPTVILAQTKKGYGMGHAGQGRMTTHQQKKLEREDLLAFRNRFDLPISDEDASELRFFRPAEDSPEMRHLHARREGPGRHAPHAAHASAQRGRASAGGLRRLCAQGRGQRNEHHHGLCAHAHQLAQRPAAGTAHRAHRGRRGAHLWHGQLVQAGGHLLLQRPKLRARGHWLGAQLPRSHRRANSGRRHQRGRRHQQLDGGRHRLLGARPGHAALLHLLLDVWLSAHWRLDLGRRRPALTRLFAGRHGRPHHAGRRGPAAPRRLQLAAGVHRAQLPGLRPVFCGRVCSHSWTTACGR
jgi:transketolase N-terminal domain/subunit